MHQIILKKKLFQFLLTSLFFLYFNNVSLCQNSYDPERIFSVIELQGDFMALRTTLENNLANLYLYAGQSQLDSVFNSMYSNLYPMTEIQFYNYITPLLSVINDGHLLILPSASSLQYHENNSLYFPLGAFAENGRLIIAENYSSEFNISPGSEILAINDVPTLEILQDMYRKQVRDGFNTSYPDWIYHHYFRNYYQFFYGYPAFYHLILKNQAGDTLHINMKGISSDSLEERKKTRYPFQNEQAQEKGVNLHIQDSIAILTIKTWDKMRLKTIYHQNFIKETDAIFKLLEKQSIDNLVIDLRDNQGGNMKYGRYLLSYLLDSSFQYITGIEKVKINKDSGRITKSLRGNMLHFTDPHQPNFDGKVYVLINGGSFSNSGIFCSRLDYYQRAFFIGQETGGNQTVLTGAFGAGGKTILPNTKISCDKANYRIIITDMQHNSGHGVLPNYPLKPVINDYLEKKDVVLDFVISRIGKGEL